MTTTDLEKGAGLSNDSPQPPHPAYNSNSAAFLPTYEEHLNSNLRSFADPEPLTNTSPISTSSKTNPNRRRLILKGLFVICFILFVIGAGTGLALGLKSKSDCAYKVHRPLRPYLPLDTFPQVMQWEKRSWTNATQQMSDMQIRSEGTTVTWHPYTTTVYLSATAPRTSTKVVVIAPTTQPTTSTEMAVVTLTSTAMVVVTSSEETVSAIPFETPIIAPTTPSPPPSAAATSTSTSATPTSTSTSTTTSGAPPPPPPATTAPPPPPPEEPAPGPIIVGTATRVAGWCGVPGEACA
ncbi:uncharacterized protein MYCGRDRAFT_89604 [Zymoseptoria tritici IPO323]|uniref:Uncharacterized protein n=1 Tax=Zymoseptoria tritici (strain CBS 115943 / IPO323) TaxID=336722 RepID=F9WZC1_ZYMTI|nr:uncharacterized protein MYCGRDRAFT_89604 [Zymoseptoria tritici IPO323]EGP92229.1 hypothetical protein MYCGRDRAFT_89604 [Zymoseptoria tritici IPO323]